MDITIDLIRLYKRNELIREQDITENTILEVINLIRYFIKNFKEMNDIDRMKYEIKNLMVLEEYFILKYDIDKLYK